MYKFKSRNSPLHTITLESTLLTYTVPAKPAPSMYVVANWNHLETSLFDIPLLPIIAPLHTATTWG